MANGFQRKVIYPRTEQEDRAHQNSIFAGDGFFQLIDDPAEVERRRRVREGT